MHAAGILTFLTIVSVGVTIYLIQRVRFLDKKVETVLHLKTQEVTVDDVRRIAENEVFRKRYAAPQVSDDEEEEKEDDALE